MHTLHPGAPKPAAQRWPGSPAPLADGPDPHTTAALPASTRAAALPANRLRTTRPPPAAETARPARGATHLLRLQALEQAGQQRGQRRGLLRPARLLRGRCLARPQAGQPRAAGRAVQALPQLLPGRIARSSGWRPLQSARSCTARMMAFGAHARSGGQRTSSEPEGSPTRGEVRRRQFAAPRCMVLCHTCHCKNARLPQQPPAKAARRPPAQQGRGSFRGPRAQGRGGRRGRGRACRAVARTAAESLASDCSSRPTWSSSARLPRSSFSTALACTPAGAARGSSSAAGHAGMHSHAATAYDPRARRMVRHCGTDATTHTRPCAGASGARAAQRQHQARWQQQ